MTDTINIDTIAINCGLLLAAPQRSDGGDPRIFQQLSAWSQRLYACSSAIRASIKTVGLKFNGTTDLANLVVSNVTAKAYGDGPEPLWAIENTGTSPLWGLINDRYEKAEHLFTRRSDGLYLPLCWSDFTGFDGLYDSLAGSIVFQTAMDSVYMEGRTLRQ